MSQAASFTFNPLEISICGLSGSGKTTLMEKLALQWHGEQRIFGYVKHDAHRFYLDRPGKDTFRAAAAGAKLIMINDSQQQAIMTSLPFCVGSSVVLLAAEFVIVEGYKQLALPKLLLLDADLDIFSHLTPEAKNSYVGYVGPWTRPPARLAQESTVPYFHRDAADGIIALIEGYFAHTLARRPLYGLVLTGGRSQRMGKNKAQLSYHGGVNQLARTADLLSVRCDKVFYSARADQVAEHNQLSTSEAIIDTFLEFGPIGGILSAMRKYPEAAWLVAAVDLPLLDDALVARLISARNPYGFATAFQSADNKFIEPLCTIYEPKCFPVFLTLVGFGYKCPSKILEKIGATVIIQQDNSQAFFNANTPKEYQKFFAMRETHRGGPSG